MQRNILKINNHNHMYSESLYYVLCRVVFLCMNILRISLWPSDTGISAAAFHTVWSFGQETIFHIVLRIQPLTHIVQSFKGNHIFFLWWFHFLNNIACNSNDHSLNLFDLMNIWIDGITLSLQLSIWKLYISKYVYIWC